MNQHARVEVRPIPFIDVAAQRRRLGQAIDDATTRVLTHCQFLMGPEVGTFETELAAFCGAKYALSCSSGTDALVMTLMAKGIGRGDAVFCPTFTFCATAESIALVGATPVLVDVDAETFNIDVASLKSAIVTAKALGLKPKAVIPVDLFGLPADHDAIAEIAQAETLFILDDAAQGFGGSYNGRAVGTFGHATATSFFPAKPLGCYGDGGAVLTDDEELLAILKSVRVHGGGSDKYDNVRLGLTARLDTIQAAVLLEKLKIFRDEIETRNRVAARYTRALQDVATVPVVPEGCTSVWAQYTLRLAPGRRDGLARALQAEGIPTAIYYAKPLHKQTAYCDFPVAGSGLAVSERLADEVISLPMHAYLDEPTQDRIVDAVRRALR
jgi:dTDP-4-amino-4,6-dideoxygalactose transaminase